MARGDRPIRGCTAAGPEMAAERGRVEAPVIVAALPGAGHDGLPELVLRIRYENGALGDVIVDNAAGVRLLSRCGADRIEALVGQSWREVRNALLENELENELEE